MSHRNPLRKTIGFYEVMETSYRSGNGDTSFKPSKPMEAFPRKHGVNSPGKSSQRESSVNFDARDKCGDKQEQRKRYLTAKYGAHQMLLIKKRLEVEMWVFEELKRLYCTEVS